IDDNAQNEHHIDGTDTGARRRQEARRCREVVRMRDVDVAVIGAGAAGIAAARALGRQRVVVIEARNRVGGRAWTYRQGSPARESGLARDGVLDGLALDLGCGWLHSADENEWDAIAPKLGFKVDTMLPPWERPAHPANFGPGERNDYRAAWERFFARVD